MRAPRFLAALFLLLLGGVAALAVGGAGTAGAAPSGPAVLFDEPLPAIEGTTAVACQDSYRPGTAGVATQVVDAPPGLGFLEVGLGQAAGDWDVALFDTAGNVLAASAELGPVESASGWTLKGGPVRIQVCRRTGDAPFVPVTLSREAATGNADALRADPPQLVDVRTPTRASKDALTKLGLDLTEHGGTHSLGVVIHGEEDRAALRKAGFTWDVLVPDLVAQTYRQRLAEERTAARAARALPSGRTATYRRLADYNAEMKQLAADNPGFVRTFVMPNKTWLGKEVMGLEIAENVNRNDGRPAFFNMGVHHAREWPAGEMPMEWAHELVRGFKSGDARTVNVVRNSRNIIVPIINPDGFEASREAGQLAGQAGGRDESVPDTVYLILGATTGGEYRRKNCRLPDDSEAGNCATSLGLAEPGVDPNRNYGGLWGGPGADTNPATQTYRGPGPFSEPETRNVQSVVSNNQVTTLISNHTTAALFLRAPGLASLGDPVDENKGYKALGDAIAKETGYLSQKSFELYDTTGTTEDWSYNATGGFGFTSEIYCGQLNYTSGDCDDPAFHPTYETGVVKEWEGTNPVADHVGDPAGAYDGGGNREGYYIAAESTINPERHSIIEGSAPAGAKLRLTKSFKTETFPQADGNPILFDDKLETVYDVGADGKFTWHVNPSTRPIVAKPRGKDGAGDPSPAETTTGGPAGSSETGDDPDDGAATPDPTNSPNPPTTNYNDHPFTIPATGDNQALVIDISWVSPLSDWDVFLYEDTNGDGKSGGTDKMITSSASGASTAEQVRIAGDTALAKDKKYVLRVVNYAALEDYTVKKTYEGFEPFTPAQKESWTLTCEVGGKVLQTTQVQIERGEKKSPDLSACVAAAPGGGNGGGGGAGGGGAGGGGGGGAGGGGGVPACLRKPGFASVGVKGLARGAARLAFKRGAAGRGGVDVKVYRQTKGRTITRTKVFARFTGLKKSLRWNGRSTKGSERKAPRGFYFVRYRIRTADGADIRRVALQRKRKRFKTLKPFYGRNTCGTPRQFKLSRPVFGGRGDTPLKVSYLLSEKADATVVVRRGSKVVKRFTAKGVAADAFKRETLRSQGLRKGLYRVSLTVGGKTTTLFSRRL